MKIKIKKKTIQGSIKLSPGKSFDKRLKLSRNFRLALIGGIVLLLLYSVVNVYAAYQKPETSSTTVPILSYSHQGKYDYGAYLKPNTIYPEVEYLRPGQGIFFKNIIENITSSFTYTFTIDRDAQINGNYNINAVIQTSLWRKEFPLSIQNASGVFQNHGRQAQFRLQAFEIDLNYFENIVSQIETETGVTVTQPQLHINCAITVFAQTPEKMVSKTITPTISFSLKTRQIEIIAPETNQQSFVETETQIIEHPEVIQERNQWTTIIYVVIVLLVISSIFTQTKKEKISKIDKEVNKIYKKYGEWIIEVNEKPVPVDKSSLIVLKAFSDIIKISEELTKPVLHYKSKDNNHFYYILDDATLYQYQLQLE